MPVLSRGVGADLYSAIVADFRSPRVHLHYIAFDGSSEHVPARYDATTTALAVGGEGHADILPDRGLESGPRLFQQMDQRCVARSGRT